MDKNYIIKLINSFFNGDFKEKNQRVEIKIKKTISSNLNNIKFDNDFMLYYQKTIQNYFKFKEVSFDFKDDSFNFKSYYTYKELNISSENNLQQNLKKELDSIINNNDINDINYILINSFLLRASYDISLNYCTIDWKKAKNNKDNLKLLLYLLHNFSDINYFNLNYRELQYNSSKKNTQLRLNLSYVYELFRKNINLDPYIKYCIENSKIEPKNKKKENFWSKYSEYFNILDYNNKELSQQEIQEFRKSYGLNQIDNNTIIRSTKLKKIANETLQNQCHCCRDIHRIENRTFKRKNSDTYYLELHHIIPFAQNKSQNDAVDNYTKLCPACHRSLTKGSADESLQRQNIENIIKNTRNFNDFVKREYPEINDINSLIDFIYKSLT